jgi:hypothetical protein
MFPYFFSIFSHCFFKESFTKNISNCFEILNPLNSEKSFSRHFLKSVWANFSAVSIFCELIFSNETEL